MLSQVEGSFIGLGIELKAQQKSLEIVSVILGSPADETGVHAGERIVEVDGMSTADISTDEAANLLRGAEGSAANVKIVDEQGCVRDIQLVRRRVQVPSIEDAKIADSEYNIAYLRLANFQKTTSRDLDAVLWKLHRQGMQSLIVDLRGNPGGLLPAAVDAADEFVSSGDIQVLFAERARDQQLRRVSRHRCPDGKKTRHRRSNRRCARFGRRGAECGSTIRSHSSIEPQAGRCELSSVADA